MVGRVSSLCWVSLDLDTLRFVGCGEEGWR